MALQNNTYADNDKYEASCNVRTLRLAAEAAMKALETAQVQELFAELCATIVRSGQASGSHEVTIGLDKVDKAFEIETTNGKDEYILRGPHKIFAKICESLGLQLTIEMQTFKGLKVTISWSQQ